MTSGATLSKWDHSVSRYCAAKERSETPTYTIVSIETPLGHEPLDRVAQVVTFPSNFAGVMADVVCTVPLLTFHVVFRPSGAQVNPKVEFAGNVP